jgi:hypothetical protein
MTIIQHRQILINHIFIILYKHLIKISPHRTQEVSFIHQNRSLLLLELKNWENYSWWLYWRWFGF